MVASFVVVFVSPVTGSTAPAATVRVVVGSKISFVKTGRPRASVPACFPKRLLKSPDRMAAVGIVVRPL